MHRPRSEMIAETRAKLITAARKAFGEKGYAGASMDDFTAEAGLTRGALYHHFGDKKGLLLAVITEIDAEMTERLAVISGRAASRWQRFVDQNVNYLKMALEPEIQRIVLRDGPSVLGDPSAWPTALNCVEVISSSIKALQEEGIVRQMDPEAAARLVTGASTYAAQWIANAPDPAATAEKAVAAFKTILNGLLVSPAATDPDC
ncbi:TetR/AcrR family transcriptional regulator [Aquamicrobium terrae]|uniref:AcrR family transcriptional regulator n=1 Tax=Aquamicrobium terrae TaxID=1324945 RepID=A0ABV2N1Y4_9HYPH